MVDSESKREWKFGVRSKYIVRPSAVEEVSISVSFFAILLLPSRLLECEQVLSRGKDI